MASHEQHRNRTGRERPGLLHRVAFIALKVAQRSLQSVRRAQPAARRHASQIFRGDDV